MSETKTKISENTETTEFKNAEKAFKNAEEIVNEKEKPVKKEKAKRAPRIKASDIEALLNKDVKQLTLPEAKAVIKEIKATNNCLRTQVELYKANAESALQKAQNYEKAVDSINTQINAKNNALESAINTLINTFNLINGGKL